MSLLALIAALGGGEVEPPPPTDDGWGKGTSADPVWVPPGAMTAWRAARDNADHELVEVAYQGDSTSFGEGSPITGYYPTAYLMRELSVAAGLKDAGLGQYARGGSNGDHIPYPMTYGPLVSTTGADNADVGGMYGPYTLAPHLIDFPGDQVTWQGEGRYIRVGYGRGGQTLGNFTVSVDGGPVVATIPHASAASPDLYEQTWVDLGTGGPHEVTFTALGGSPTAPPPIAHANTSGSTGTLPPGTYYYVATHTPLTGGETTVSAERSTTVTAGQVVNVVFNRTVPGAGPVRVYRATTPGGPYGFVGSYGGNPNGPSTWQDDGTATPGDAPPTTSTAGPSGWNKVSADVEWFNQPQGIVWHRDGISGAESSAAVGPIAQALHLGLRGGVPGPKPATRRVRLAINVYGINNQQKSADLVENHRANLRTWVDLARAAGASPVLCIPLYERANQHATVDPGQTEPRYVRFRQVHRDVAIEKECALVDLGSGGALAGQWSFGTDPHLGETEYRAQAEYLWHNLLKL